MNEVFALIHKGANLQNSLSNAAYGKEKSEQIEMVSKITDQNVRNVFNAFEKHKAMMDEKFTNQEVDIDRLKAVIN